MEKRADAEHSRAPICRTTWREMPQYDRRRPQNKRANHTTRGQLARQRLCLWLTFTFDVFCS